MTSLLVLTLDQLADLRSGAGVLIDGLVVRLEGGRATCDQCRSWERWGTAPFGTCGSRSGTPDEDDYCEGFYRKDPT